MVRVGRCGARLAVRMQNGAAPEADAKVRSTTAPHRGSGRIECETGLSPLTTTFTLLISPPRPRSSRRNARVRLATQALHSAPRTTDARGRVCARAGFSAVSGPILPRLALARDYTTNATCLRRHAALRPAHPQPTARPLPVVLPRSLPLAFPREGNGQMRRAKRSRRRESAALAGESDSACQVHRVGGVGPYGNLASPSVHDDADLEACAEEPQCTTGTPVMHESQFERETT
ncbi:hypothetical protein B0H10DRAFT_2211577 [Mycena sp. CBHHK59/15]|nr:hypothetical protein B0H10DRAFT_2211577 [Mycena sp. CBHHK59/15]